MPHRRTFCFVFGAACLSGSYAASPQSTSCEKCPAGKATGTASAAVSCSACPAGSFSAAEASSCTGAPCCSSYLLLARLQFDKTAFLLLACAEGTYAELPESTGCQACGNVTLCPLASVAPLTAAPTAFVAQSSPLTAAIDVTSFRQALGITFATLVLLSLAGATILVVCFKIDFKAVDFLR